MKVFVSYAREDKPFCIRVIETLQAHEVWYDQRIHAGQDWWKEIQRRLAWCEVFIYLLSRASVASRHCRREWVIARKLKRAIIPVLIDSDTALPEVMRAQHYVDLSNELTAQNVSRLLNAILIVERARNARRVAPATTAASPNSRKQEDAGPSMLIADALRAIDAEDFERAIRLLRHARDSGYDSRFVRVDELLRMAQDARSRQAQPPVAIAQRPVHATGKAASVPPAPTRPAPLAPARSADNPSLAVNDFLPMLQWLDIPRGSVTIASIASADEAFGEMVEQVDKFAMSKYPVTTAQFAIFVEAADGYRNPRWWAFSAYARRFFESGKQPAKPRVAGDKLPRAYVNWYEAMAFANWLGAQLRMKITLPTIAQWQRAAKGDDDRRFPWGDDYDEARCNTVETGLRQTTPVDRYPKGASAFGVCDMAGNIWEWTLTAAPAIKPGRDLRRAVAGGSYVTTCAKAQIASRYALEPRVRYSTIGIRLVALQG